MLLDVEPEIERVLGAFALEKEVEAVQIQRRSRVCVATPFR